MARGIIHEPSGRQKRRTRNPHSAGMGNGSERGCGSSASMAEKITVAIVGPGAIGGFLAGVFMNAGSKVTLVARREAVPGIVERGLCLKTALLGDRVIWPKAVETLEEASDVICLATKVTELPAALSQIRKGVGQDTIIIPFQNGLEHVDLLKKEFGNRVAVGMIGNIVAEKNESGCIVSSSKKVTIELGSRKVPRDRLEAVGQLLQKSGIAVSIYDNEGEVIWHKLARLAPLAALTAASGKVLGEIRDDERWRGKLIACTEEAAALAQKEGVFIASADILKQL